MNLRLFFRLWSLHSLAAALGCGPDQGCPISWYDDDFDSVWQIKFLYNPTIDHPTWDSINKMVTILPSPRVAATTRVGGNTTAGGTRRLRKKKHEESFVLPGWHVLGTVTRQYFDPLEFSSGKTKFGTGL
jgi:hypothetical protein